MAIRYTDLDLMSNGARDFVIRKRTPTNAQLAAILVLTLMISVGLAVGVSDKFLLALIMIVLIGGAGWYVILTMQRNRDLLLATEFQNALFTSALGLNNKFCMIIRRNGSIVYLDRLFHEMFPDFVRESRRSIDVLLEQAQVSRADSDKIFSAIERGVYEKVIFDIRGSDGSFSKIVMAIEPILRPSGFILLRGREFVEARSSAGGADRLSPSSLMSKSSITLFSHVMDTMNMGVYMTTPGGNIVYANPVLEHWLGYSEGEITAGNLSLQDIIHQTNGARPDAIEPDNYEGEIMLQKKTGGLMKSFINQKVIRDDANKTVGCTALVHNFIEQTDNAKKKLW